MNHNTIDRHSQQDPGDAHRQPSRPHDGRARLDVMPWILALSLAFLLTPFVLAEDNKEAAFEDMVEVSEVLLDVLVTDRKGNVVLDLGPEDFIVEDEGLSLAPTHVSFYSNRFQLKDDVQGIQHPASDEVIADRYFVFFFHDPRNFGDPRLVRQHLEATRRSRQWVEKEMLPGDWVAITSFDFKLKVHQDFTQDRGQVFTAIERAAQGKSPSNEWKSRRPEVGSDQPSLLAHLPEGKKLRDQTTHMYDALTLLSDATSDIVGRKSLMLFTVGFGEVRQRSGLISEPDQRYYPKMRESLNDNNVAIYPINLVPSSRNAQGHFLNQLAADSGGTYQELFVNFLAPIRRIADESNGYYLLSYQAQHPAGEQGYREVEVKTRNPELKVRARRGYRYGS